MDCKSINNYVPFENDLVLDSGEVSKTRVFRCCVCSRLLNLGPIFQCMDEHRTCSSCHKEGPMKCFVCSLPVTQHYLSLEVVLESMNIACFMRARKTLSIFGPCSCPEAGCNFHSDFKDFASHFNTNHLFAILPFKYGMMYGTVIRRDEKTVILQELDDRALFVLKNKFERMGNIITLYHFTPTTLNMKFSLNLVARTSSGERYYLRDVKVQNIQPSSTSVRQSTFLLIPTDFSPPPGWITLEIYINRIGAA